jgi:hypothetical protein
MNILKDLFWDFRTKSAEPFRIGWIIGNQLEEARLFKRINVNIGGISLVRYHWIAFQVNSTPEYQLEYEIFRPWRKYDALLFLKAMGERSLSLINKYKALGRPVFFDANVNYYQIEGQEYYKGMLPSEQQREQAVRITKAVDGVIADSEYLKVRCEQYNSNVCWIPDNVRIDLVPSYQPWKFNGRKLPLFWSGDAVKLFELLAIEEILKKFSTKIELVLVTNDTSALERWYPNYKDRFQALLSLVPHKIIPYQSIEHLFQIYTQGGIVISPRFLDNSYNFGHTEWKITLPMACGRIAFCSPLPSYVKVSELSSGEGIKICHTIQDWEQVLDAILAGEIDLEKEERAAKAVVEQFYSTPVVAQKHSEFVRSIISEYH